MEQKYKLAVCRSDEEFKEKQDYFKDFDIVFYKTPNVCRGAHEITIYKQPKDIDDWDLAYAIDGYFYSVTRCGSTLTCWYD